jgi:hypothetical protein
MTVTVRVPGAGAHWGRDRGSAQQPRDTTHLEAGLPVQHSDHVAWRAIGGEIVLVDLRTNTMLGLNTTGGVLWQALSHPTAAADLAVASGMEYATVAAFLADLQRRDLVAPATSVGQAQGAPDLDPLVPGSPPPTILWTEDLRTFAACAQAPTQSPLCDQTPGS